MDDMNENSETGFVVDEVNQVIKVGYLNRIRHIIFHSTPVKGSLYIN